ncbi:hypothetical protein NPIL_306651 [Nephila pilipes]|uniref:Uncharacterized protein n=1 Tax=Nephila pilipes TaxID=299642 RepID=A0A8X6UDA8_NEPPI|nr:hypothetical protein NPIL_306651 [Nephila pilipes]
MEMNSILEFVAKLATHSSYTPSSATCGEDRTDNEVEAVQHVIRLIMILAGQFWLAFLPLPFNSLHFAVAFLAATLFSAPLNNSSGEPSAPYKFAHIL